MVVLRCRINWRSFGVANMKYSTPRLNWENLQIQGPFKCQLVKGSKQARQRFYGPSTLSSEHRSTLLSGWEELAAILNFCIQYNRVMNVSTPASMRFHSVGGAHFVSGVSWGDWYVLLELKLLHRSFSSWLPFYLFLWHCLIFLCCLMHCLHTLPLQVHVHDLERIQWTTPAKRNKVHARFDFMSPRYLFP